ncbi:MAG: hypothetical protein ACRD0O_10850, partial [Acidimicrobiia bacterium]
MTARIGRLLLTATGGEGPGASRDVEFRVSEALLAHIEDLCADGALTMILEDLQWADPSALLHAMVEFAAFLAAEARTPTWRVRQARARHKRDQRLRFLISYARVFRFR